MKTKRQATRYFVYCCRGGVLWGLKDSLSLYAFCARQVYRPAGVYCILLYSLLFQKICPPQPRRVFSWSRRSRPLHPRNHPDLLYVSRGFRSSGYRWFFPEVKPVYSNADHSFPSSAGIKICVELYLPFTCCLINHTFPVHTSCISKQHS